MFLIQPNVWSKLNSRNEFYNDELLKKYRGYTLLHK